MPILDDFDMIASLIVPISTGGLSNMADGEMRNVFVSHIHEDDAGLAELKTLLGNNGMTVRNYSITSDKFNNAKAEDYIKYKILTPRIQQCSVLVVYISSDTKTSHYVNWEIECAHKQGKRVVGVWAHGEKGCDLPEALEKYADAVVGWTGNSIIDAINGQIDNWINPDGTPRASRDIKRYSCG